MFPKIFFAITICLLSGLESNAGPETTLKGEAYKTYLSKEKTLVLDLQTALQIAADQNLELDLQEYSVKDAKDRLLRNSSEFLPSLNLIQSLNQRDGHFQIFGNQVLPIRQTSVYPRMVASFNLFQGGRVLFGWISEKNSLNAEKALQKDTEQNILTRTTNSYFSLQRYSSELDSEIARLKQAEQNLKERQIALNLGEDIKLSVLLAKQEFEESKARIATLKGQFYAESSRLNQLLNLPSEVLLIPLSEPVEREILILKSELTLNALLKNATQARPDLQAQEYLIKAQKARQIQSASAFLPTVQVVGNLGLIGPNYTSLYGDEQLALTMQYDVLRNLGVAALADYLRAKHGKERLETQFRQSIKELERNLTELYLTVISGKENWQASQAALVAAQESYRQAQIRLKEGLSSPYELTVAQTGLERAQSNYYESALNYKIAQVNLLRGLGLSNIQNLVKGVEL